MHTVLSLEGMPSTVTYLNRFTPLVAHDDYYEIKQKQKNDPVA